MDEITFNLLTMLLFIVFPITWGGGRGRAGGKASLVVQNTLTVFTFFTIFVVFGRRVCVDWPSCTNYFHSFHYFYFIKGEGGGGGAQSNLLVRLFFLGKF